MASRLQKPLAEWTSEDVLALVAEKVEESQRLDYKRELKLTSKSERVEAAKDSSGMANATGGVLIYGVEEEELPDGRRVPVKPTPLSQGDAQARLEDILYSAVSPPLNVAAVTLEAPGGGYFLVVRVYQRSGPLHMVDAYGQHRYFIRTGLSTRPMEAHEVERAFRELGATEERVAALVRELPLVPRIDRSRFRPNEEATGREPAGSPWTSLVTIPLDRSGVMLSMRTPGHHDFPLVDVGSAFIGDPAYILHGGYSVNEWGYTSEDFDPHENLVHRTRLYREGACEWGVRYSGDNFQHIPTVVVVENVHDALAYFASVYQRLDYFGRLRVWVRIDNADRSEFKIDPNYILRGGPRPPDGDALSVETETNVEALLADPMPLVHEAMDLIWQGYGLPRAFLFSPEGEFLKRRR